MSTAEEQVEQRKELSDHEAENQKKQEMLRQAYNQDGQLSRGWMKEILDTDDLENYLNEYEIQKVRALINRQWVLANLSNAQTHDRWYKLEVMKYKIYGSFPPQETPIQAEVRAFLMDDPAEELTALTQGGRYAIDQIITSLQNMVTRSRDGFERKQINTNIARTESETDGDGDGDGGRLRGLF